MAPGRSISLSRTLWRLGEGAYGAPGTPLGPFTAILSNPEHGWTHPACHQPKQHVEHWFWHKLHSTACSGYLVSLQQFGHVEIGSAKCSTASSPTRHPRERGCASSTRPSRVASSSVGKGSTSGNSAGGASMNDVLFERLLYEEESTTLDFKKEQYRFAKATEYEKSELLKDILGFANAWRRSEAYILIGVEEMRGD